jgi:hypothetical protein
MQQDVPDPRPTVDWAEVESVARLAFNIWIAQPELVWAKHAWQVLANAKLTTYQTELERYQVLFRLLVLGGIYSDFCDAAWDEYSEPSYSYWAEPLELDPFILGQLCARLPDPDPNGADESEALEMLVENERQPVVAAMLAAFGGVPGFYASLWESKKVELPEGEEESAHEDDAFDPENSQMAGYSWVDQGCARCR